MRTGSTWLCSLLSKHPDIDCRLELLHYTAFKGSASKAKQYLDECLFATSPKTVRGFKIMYHQMRGPRSASCGIFATLLRDIYKCKVINIKRRNCLETYVSHKLATQAGIWNLFENNHIQPHQGLNFETKKCEDIPKYLDQYNVPITIDINDWLLFQKKLTVWDALIAELFPDRLEIYYEDLPDMNRIWDYLGVPPANVTTDTIKLRRLPVEQLVSNLDDINYLR